ncbi:hypothetical protein V8F06_014478 [Rhypophila decipiens]
MAKPFSGVPVPNEIILEIAKHVAQYNNLSYYKIGRDMSDKPIVNFGMVCRRLRQISAHLLVPHIRVDFKISSLQRLEEISNHELVRKGVRQLTVSLASFNKELCDDFETFIKFYVLDLKKFSQKMYGEGLGDEALQCFWVLQSWTRIIIDVHSGSRRTSSEEEANAFHLTLLDEAHANYKRLHDEQELLFPSGEFANRVAVAMSRMPLAKRLNFVDELPFLMENIYGTPRFGMAGTWEMQEMQFAQSSLYPTLIQLPIAVHQAGISLHSVEISLEGIHCDEVLNADPATLRSLPSAFKSLKEATFRGCPVLNRDLKALPTYLNQMDKNPHLKKISIHTCGFYKSAVSTAEESDDSRLPGSILSLSSKISHTSLLNVRLCRVGFHCADLFAFISSLPMSMQWLQLDEVDLLDGTWEGVLDELRLKMYDLKIPGEVYRYTRDGLELQGLTGGEFDAMEPHQVERLFEDCDSTIMRTFLETYSIR